MTPLVGACAMRPPEDYDAAALLAAACTKTDEMRSEGPGIAQHTEGMACLQQQGRKRDWTRTCRLRM